jgi:hypothetical protein
MSFESATMRAASSARASASPRCLTIAATSIRDGARTPQLATASTAAATSRRYFDTDASCHARPATVNVGRVARPDRTPRTGNRSNSDMTRCEAIMSFRFGLFATLALAACPSPRTPPVRPIESQPTARLQQPASTATPASLAFIDPAASSRSVTVTARLARIRQETPLCGGVHFGTLMEYELVSIETGTLALGNGLLVGVGCPDIPRPSYDTNAGTLQAFRIGELHRLTLSNDRNDSRGMAVLETQPLFYAISADPV